jgi:activating signal cointegrator 1
MKALTLTQPWATLVAIGEKTWETRSWSTSYRGPLLIHAAKSFPKDCRDLCAEEPFRTALGDIGHLDSWRELPRGAVVAVAELVACARIDATFIRAMQVLIDDVLVPTWEDEFGNYTPGRFAWRLENVRPATEPISCRGALGLWEPPTDVMEQVRAQIEALDATGNGTDGEDKRAAPASPSSERRNEPAPNSVTRPRNGFTITQSFKPGVRVIVRLDGLPDVTGTVCDSPFEGFDWDGWSWVEYDAPLAGQAHFANDQLRPLESQVMP